MINLIKKLFNHKPLKDNTKKEQEKVKPNITYFIKQEGKLTKYCSQK